MTAAPIVHLYDGPISCRIERNVAMSLATAHWLRWLVLAGPTVSSITRHR